MSDRTQKSPASDKNDGHVASSSASFVRFDVGGTLYKVSRSLLEKHPDTMLARMASETWNDEKKRSADGEPKPIFIERDGERFRYVLDYMRDAQVSLGARGHVSPESLYKELEYYGFQNVQMDAIQLSYRSVAESIDHMNNHKEKMEKHFKKLKSNIEEQISMLENQKKALALAHFCHSRYVETRGELRVFLDYADCSARKALKQISKNMIDMDMVQSQFEQFGLKFTRAPANGSYEEGVESEPLSAPDSRSENKPHGWEYT